MQATKYFAEDSNEPTTFFPIFTRLEAAFAVHLCASMSVVMCRSTPRRSSTRCSRTRCAVVHAHHLADVLQNPMKKAGTRRRRLTQAGSAEIGDGVIDNLINDLKENAFRRADATPVGKHCTCIPVTDTGAEAARSGDHGGA